MAKKYVSNLLKEVKNSKRKIITLILLKITNIKQFNNYKMYCVSKIL